MRIKTINHILNEEQDGEIVHVDKVEYVFSEDVSEEAKEEVRNHVPRLKSKAEVERVIELIDGEAE